MAIQNLTRTKGRHKVKTVDAFDTLLDVAVETEVSGDTYQLAVLPPKTLIKAVSMIVITPNDAGTSADVDLGIDGDDSLVAAFDLSGPAGVTTSEGDVYLPTGGVLTYTPTYVGAMTEGKVAIHVEYSELGKCNGAFTSLV